MGQDCAWWNEYGSDNTLIGQGVAYQLGKGQSDNSTCSGNTFIGRSAGFYRENSVYNCYIGFEAGKGNTTRTTGDYNTCIGGWSGGFENGDIYPGCK